MVVEFATNGNQALQLYGDQALGSNQAAKVPNLKQRSGRNKGEQTIITAIDPVYEACSFRTGQGTRLITKSYACFQICVCQSLISIKPISTTTMTNIEPKQSN